MKKNFIESLVGVAVIALAISFFFFAKKQAKLTDDTQGYYQLTARFDSIDGINVGSDVRLAGIKIGTVTGEDLDTVTYEALLTISLREDVKIPIDSIVSIISSGLLGKKYISIEPGAEEEYFIANQNILYTQSSVNLEALVSKFMFKESE